MDACQLAHQNSGFRVGQGRVGQGRVGQDARPRRHQSPADGQILSHVCWLVSHFDQVGKKAFRDVQEVPCVDILESRCSVENCKIKYNSPSINETHTAVSKNHQQIDSLWNLLYLQNLIAQVTKMDMPSRRAIRALSGLILCRKFRKPRPQCIQLRHQTPDPVVGEQGTVFWSF